MLVELLLGLLNRLLVLLINQAQSSEASDVGSLMVSPVPLPAVGSHSILIHAALAPDLGFSSTIRLP